MGGRGRGGEGRGGEEWKKGGSNRTYTIKLLRYSPLILVMILYQTPYLPPSPPHTCRRRNLLFYWWLHNLAMFVFCGKKNFFLIL